MKIIPTAASGSSTARSVLAELERFNLPQSSLADDLTFLHRVNLDVCGELPTLDAGMGGHAETDARFDGRARVGRLLGGGEVADATGAGAFGDCTRRPQDSANLGPNELVARRVRSGFTGR
jgi:hypothetical protein